jgi:DNA end-binding protein Ku
MARPIWGGSLSFGLVNVPVRLFSATEQRDVSFNQLERDTGRRVRMMRVAEGTKEEIPYDRVVKGYELGDGRFVMISPDELDALAPEKSKNIEIEDFVALEDIDPVYFEKSYYLAPGPGAEKPYALLLRAMADAGRVGIAQFVMRAKQYLAAIRPMDGVLALETMRYPDEVRSVEELPGVPVDVEPTERELTMAHQLIESLTVEWDPSRYRDTYRESVLALIEQKAAGHVVEAAPAGPAPAPVVDLLAALEASLAGSKERHPTALTHRGDGSAIEQLTKDELLARAREAGIRGRSQMSRDQLVHALKAS